MKDILLQKLFEIDRWERAIEKGIEKDIDKAELRKLCTPEIRVALYDAIVSGNYEIAPPHQALIPKGNGEFRTVYVNENLDRLFLSIVNDLFFELFPQKVHSACKSYQKGIGCGRVVQEVSRIVYESADGTVGWKSDLTRFFDNVPIRFIDKVFDWIEEQIGESAILNIVRKYYHADLCFDVDGNLIEHYQSLKQGCSIASYLADAVLYHIDSELASFPGYYARYSDDLLYVGPYYEETMALLKMELDEMGLALNPKKVEYLHKDRWFKFLGFNIKGNQITLSKSRVKSFQKEIEKRSIRNRKMTAKKAMNAINRYLYIGDGKHSWATQVLPIINVEKDIDELNKFVMDCIRACQTGKRKIGGLGSVADKPDYTIIRGTGRNVTRNYEKTLKEIDGYKTIRCMQKDLLTDRDAYDTLVRCM